MMARYHRPVSESAAMSGSEKGPEILLPTIAHTPAYEHDLRTLEEVAAGMTAACAGQVYKSDAGDLRFGVHALTYRRANTRVAFAAVDDQALTNNTTNYIYLVIATATLTVNVTGFPVYDVIPHFPLATVATGTASGAAVDGQYDPEDITDCRAEATFNATGQGQMNLLDWQESVLDELDFTTSEPSSPSVADRYLNTGTGDSSETTQAVTANRIYEWNGTSWTEITPTEGAVTVVEDRDMLIGFNGSAWVDIGTFALLAEAQTFFGATDLSGAEAETLSDGSNADGLHVHAVAGLAAAVQDLMPNLLLSAGAESSDERTITIQARDAANNALGERMLIRVWIATADFGAPDGTGNTVAVDAGTTYEIETANAAYKIISDATGKVEIGVTISGAATRYILAEIDGRIYSSGQVDWAA